MKYLSVILSVLLIAFILCACESSADTENTQNTSEEISSEESVSEAASAEDVTQPEENNEAGTADENVPDSGSKVLVAYFSATNNTKAVAEKIAAATGGELYQIVPEIPYTDADLDYNTDCRANREQNDDTARPKIAEPAANMDGCDTVFIGYPIWWGQAPKIIYTFLEGYDLNGKTIIPFCTSGSSPIGSSAENIHSLADGANWLEGKRFGAGASSDEVNSWINSLELN